MIRYVLAPNYERFILWVKENKYKLQDCNYLSDVSRMQGIHPREDVELVVFRDWRKGRNKEFQVEARRLMFDFENYRYV